MAAAPPQGKITVATIRADAERFSKSHSWYKHIPWTGQNFMIYFHTGAVITDCRQNEASGHTGLHMYLATPDTVQNYAIIGVHPASRENLVLLTPTLRGNDSEEPGKASARRARQAYGRTREVYTEFLAKHGLSRARQNGDDDEYDNLEGLIYEKERQRMIGEIVDKATIIAKAMNVLSE